MSIGISNFQTIYQTYYPDASLPYLVPEDAPLLNMMLGGNTDTQVSGDVVDMPWLIGPSAGVSQTFSVAANNAANSPTALRPTVRMSQFYKNLSFLDKDDVLSKGEASYGELMETVVRGVRMDIFSKIDQVAHGNGSGNRASFTATGSAQTVLTLSTSPTGLTGDTNGQALSSPVNQTVFEIGDQVVITTTNPKDGTQPTIAAGPFTVTKVDGNASTITLATSFTGASSSTVYGIALYGDTLGFSSSLVYPSLIGLDAFNPFGGVATTDSFLGVNRSNFPTRTAGQTFDSITNPMSIETAIRRLGTLMRNSGVVPGGCTLLMFPTDMDALDGKLQSQERYTQTQLGLFFFDAIAVNSTIGRISVVADPHMQQGFCRLIAPGAVQLMYRNGLPHFATLATGLEEQWGANYDGREKRLRAYCQTRVVDPRRLGILKLPLIS